MEATSDGILKINTDGSFIEDTQSGGWGFTIRNDQGTLLAAGVGKLRHVALVSGGPGI